MRVKLCSLISAASLMIFAALAGTATAATAPSGPPDRHRHGRRRCHRGDARDPGSRRHPSPRRQRRRRRGHRRRGARRHRAVLVRHRRRRLPAAPDRGRRGHLDRPPRDRSGGDARRLVLGERVALPFTPARYSGLSVGVPGTVAGWANSLDRYGTISLARSVTARDPDRARRLRRSTAPSSTKPKGTLTSSTTSPPRPRSSSTRTGRRRTSAPSSATRISRARTSGLRISARRASTAARSPTRSSRRCRDHQWRRPPTTCGGRG